MFVFGGDIEVRMSCWEGLSPEEDETTGFLSLDNPVTTGFCWALSWFASKDMTSASSASLCHSPPGGPESKQRISVTSILISLMTLQIPSCSCCCCCCKASKMLESVSKKCPTPISGSTSRLNWLVLDWPNWFKLECFRHSLVFLCLMNSWTFLNSLLQWPQMWMSSSSSSSVEATKLKKK